MSNRNRLKTDSWCNLSLFVRRFVELLVLRFFLLDYEENLLLFRYQWNLIRSYCLTTLHLITLSLVTAPSCRISFLKSYSRIFLIQQQRIVLSIFVWCSHSRVVIFTLPALNKSVSPSVFLFYGIILLQPYLPLLKVKPFLHSFSQICILNDQSHFLFCLLLNIRAMLRHQKHINNNNSFKYVLNHKKILHLYVLYFNIFSQHSSTFLSVSFFVCIAHLLLLLRCCSTCQSMVRELRPQVIRVRRLVRRLMESRQ